LLLSLSRPMRSDAPTLDDVLAFIHAHEKTTQNALPSTSS